MPTPTYTPLANITLGSSAASVTFSSISQAYRDLVLVVQAKAASGGRNFKLRLNSDATATYSSVHMGGNGSTTASTTLSGANILNFNLYATVETTDGFNAVVNFMDYSATDKHKAILCRENNAANGVDAVSARWASTSAITSIFLTTDAVNWSAGSTFSLFGIAS